MFQINQRRASFELSMHVRVEEKNIGYLFDRFSFSKLFRIFLVRVLTKDHVERTLVLAEFDSEISG